MTRSRMMGPRLAALSFLTVLGGCSNDRRDITEPDEPAAAFAAILSDPVEGSSPASAGPLGAAQASSSPAADDVVYVSLPPGTIAEGVSIVIRNLETGFARTEPLVDGGIDPVPAPAAVDDRLELVATLSGGATLVSVVKVPARRAPRVVRTIPPRGKTDVPLNARISVVFSEPIDPASVGPTSLRLMRGSAQVSGRIEVRDPQGLSLDFVPDTRLAGATNYQLVVSEAIRDRDGEALGAPIAVEFTTEPSSCPNYVNPSSCPPFPTMGSGVVSGVVSVRSGDGVQPLPNADVWGFIIMAGSGNGFSMAPAKTGADGAYRRTDVPDGFLVLYAAGTGYDQPCAATATVRADTPATSDIELVSQLDPRPGSATASPSISGTVYESTPDGRRPVPGARVWFEFLPDLATATTTTNEAGQYSLCRLPSGGGAVTAVKSGYTTNGIVVVIANGDQVLDIELRR